MGTAPNMSYSVTDEDADAIFNDEDMDKAHPGQPPGYSCTKYPSLPSPPHGLDWKWIIHDQSRVHQAVFSMYIFQHKWREFLLSLPECLVVDPTPSILTDSVT
jgi:hypothetical protein